MGRGLINYGSMSTEGGECNMRRITAINTKYKHNGYSKENIGKNIY
jgi:hypothetical protein